VIEIALRPVTDSLRVDGYDLEIVDDRDVVTLRVVATEAACADCLVPKSILRDIIDGMLGDRQVQYELLYPQDR
jgi:hypothetical protein